MVTSAFLKEKLGNENGALADLNRAVALGPEIPETYASLGLLQYNLLQWGPALENLCKAVNLDPSVSDDVRFYIF